MCRKLLVPAGSGGICPFWIGREAVIGAGIVGKVRLTLRTDVLVDAHRHRGIENGITVRKRVIVGEVGVLRRWIVRNNILTYWRETARGYCVSGVSGFIHESSSALHTANCLGRCRIKNFALINVSTVAGVYSQNIAGIERRIEIASELIGRRHRGGRNTASGLTVLLPREEEECPVFAVVEMRNSHRTTESPAVVILSVQRSGEQTGIGGILGKNKVVPPSVGVKSRVAENLVGLAVISVRPSLGAEALDASGRAPEFRRQC